MANPVITGQDLLDAMRIQLGGLSNAFDTDKQLYFLNEGKDEVWAVIRSLDLDYFADASQDSDSTKDDYFLDLATTVREYALPKNCREVRAIECTTPNFSDRVFEFRKFDHPDFMSARREATSLGVTFGSGLYYYTIFGTQFILAQFPEAVLTLKIWYIKSIDDIDQSGIPEILFPFNKKIVDYAAKRAILTTRNLEMTAGWKQEWEESVKMLALTAGSRQSTNPIFVTDFQG